VAELCEPHGLGAFLVEEAESEVDAFDLAKPPVGLSAFTAGKEVGLDLVEAVDHLRIDPQHRAADAAVLVFAGRGVRAPALAEFDLAFVEVLIELGPFGLGHRTVFAGWPGGAPVGQVGLVVADDVFLEDGDIAVEGLQVEVPELPAGDVGEVALRLQRDSRYVLWCSLPSHRELGMDASVRVRRKKR